MELTVILRLEFIVGRKQVLTDHLHPALTQPEFAARLAPLAKGNREVVLDQSAEAASLGSSPVPAAEQMRHF